MRELAWLARAGADVRAVFNAAGTTFRERKQLLRAILSEVVVTVDTIARTASIAIVWQGGARTEITMAMTKVGGYFQTTSEDTVELVRRLAVHYDDTTIAVVLGRHTGRPEPGCRSPRAGSRRCGSPRHPAFQPETVGPDSEDNVVVTVDEAERLLGVGKDTITRWLRDGFLTGEQLTRTRRGGS